MSYFFSSDSPSVEVEAGRGGGGAGGAGGVHNDHECKVMPLKLTIVKQKMHSCHGRHHDVICSPKVLRNVWSYDFYDDVIHC